MEMFWKRRDMTPHDVAGLRADLAALTARVRTCESETERMHDEARKWWKRAHAAELRAERNQEPESGAAPGPVTPVPPLPWGARGRRTRRSLAEHFGRARDDQDEADNGAAKGA